nr:thioester reductase domain-containing protein [Rubrobacter marinus]
MPHPGRRDLRPHGPRGLPSGARGDGGALHPVAPRSRPRRRREDLAEGLSALRTLWLNGEVVTKTLARRALRTLAGKKIFNLYSISETHEISAGELRELVESADSTYCPVGRPADPDHLYVLDEDARPVGEGIPGELYVGGEGLARGYVNLPEKTAERFIPDPFAGADARMYRSGDRARMLPDGNLEIMGRIDFMVKVRGYSIELGAVEAAIEERLAVTNCVVVADGEEGTDKRLVAYLVPDPAGGARDGRLAGWGIDPATGHSAGARRALQDALPHYMIPAVYVEAEALPLQDATGKVDRENLPPPPARGAAEPDAPEEPALPADASRPEKEERLARIFERVLRLERGYVRPEDDFFEAGGHSLAAAELAGRVEDAFGVRLPTSGIVESPTVAGLLDAIEALGRGGARREAQGHDLLVEAALETGISPEGAADGVKRLGEAESVFLTGATGFLGAFLLDGLLSKTEAKVHCLVRRRPSGDPMSPLRDALKGYGLWNAEMSERLVPVTGDLSEPLLGLSEEAFEEQADEVDAVIHAGAMVNLIYPYSALKPANVDGTREVLRLACRRRAKPLHHVSTNGVFGRGRGLCEEDTDLDDLAGAQPDGYGRSKWVAEKLVMEAAGRGLPVSVYRPGNISGHSATGSSNPKDFLGAVISESARAGLAPKIDGWRMEMTPVDFVAGAILGLADYPGAPGKTFHLANPEPPLPSGSSAGSRASATTSNAPTTPTG